MTSSGLEAAVFRHVAYCFNHVRYRVLHRVVKFTQDGRSLSWRLLEVPSTGKNAGGHVTVCVRAQRRTASQDVTPYSAEKLTAHLQEDATAIFRVEVQIGQNVCCKI
jgi:hypothetical protein